MGDGFGDVASLFENRVKEWTEKLKSLGTNLSEVEIREAAEVATYREFKNKLPPGIAGNTEAP